MFRRTSLGCITLVLLFVLAGFADRKPSDANPSDAIEFPVYMLQKISAGITPVGTKIQAKLTISTLVHGTVVPEGAILSGEVTESEAKSSGNPSKLGIRMDIAEWKNGSLTIKAYLTEWYYAGKSMMVEDGNPGYSGMHGSIGGSIGGSSGNSYPPPASPSGGQRMPDDARAQFPNDPTPEPASADPSTQRVRMKDVEAKRADDGSIALTSKKNSLKLDKYTTYVMAAGNLLPQK